MTGSGRDRRPRENRDLRLISSIRTMPHVPGIGPTNNTSDGFPKNPCCLTRVVVASTKRGLARVHIDRDKHPILAAKRPRMRLVAGNDMAWQGKIRHLHSAYLIVSRSVSFKQGTRARYAGN